MESHDRQCNKGAWHIGEEALKLKLSNIFDRNMDVLADLCIFWNWYFFPWVSSEEGWTNENLSTFSIFSFLYISPRYDHYHSIDDDHISSSFLSLFCMSYENKNADSLSCLRCPLHNHSVFLFTTVIMIKFFLDYHFWICSFF